MLRLLLEKPAFARLWAAGAISLFGDWLTLVAVSVVSAAQDGGPVALALVLAAHSMPGALASPLAGLLVDRLPRRRLLVLAAVGQGVLTLGMALAASWHAFGALKLALLVRSTLAALVPPAETAALRGVLDDDELAPGNALVGSTWSVCYVAGMAAGGLLAALSPAVAIGLDAVTFFGAALLLVGLPPLPAPETPRAPARPRRLLAELGQALDHARSAPVVLRAVLAKSPVAIAGGAGWLVTNLIAPERAPFGDAALSLGALQAVRGLGTLFGAVAAARRTRARGERASAERLASSLALGAVATLVVLGPRAGAVALLAIVLGWGTGSGANWVFAQSALQARADPRYLGRLAAMDELAVATAMCASALLTALGARAGLGTTGPALAMVAIAYATGWALERSRRCVGPRSPRGREPAATPCS